MRGVGPNAKLVHILIKKVGVKLNPQGCKDFKKEQIPLVSESSFELSSTSWCIFDIPIVIEWVDKKIGSYEYQHKLQFGEAQGSQKVVFKFHKDWLDKVLTGGICNSNMSIS